MTSDARVIDELSAEGPLAVVTTAAASESRASMLFELRHADLNGAFAKHFMTLGATDSFALRVDLMSESVIVGLAHLRRRLLVSRGRMAFATARAAYFFTRLHLIWRLMADVALAMCRKTCSRARYDVAARTIGSLLACLISRVSSMRKLNAETLPLWERHNRRLHSRYAFVAV